MENQPKIILILGAPRTGSTLLYQLIANRFDVFYFTNYINDSYYEHPAAGAAKTYYYWDRKRSVNLNNYQGKTFGSFAPSEASKIFAKWFGGRHPSQLYSVNPIPRQKEHMIRTLELIYKMFDKPIVIKNAWNCFRIETFYDLFKSDVGFLHIKRDIKKAAISDLKTKYDRGNVKAWSSATTSNYKDIMKAPYYEAVVEQQYYYNKAIDKSFSKLPKSSYHSIWYEDLCRNTGHTMFKIGSVFYLCDRLVDDRIPDLHEAEIQKLPNNDNSKIYKYVEDNYSRFWDYLYKE